MIKKIIASVVAAAMLSFMIMSVPSSSAKQTSGVCGSVPKSTAMKIAVMGDSIATPYRPAPDNNTPDSRAWMNMLKTQGGTHGWSVTLHGVGSTMASQYLPGGPQYAVTQSVKALQPTIVLMDWRANEQLNGQTPDQLKTNLLALMDEIRTANANTRFMIINPPKLWYHAFNNGPTTQEDYMVKMYEAAKERGGCWVDLVSAFPQTGPDAYSRVYMPDDIHPSNAGHAIYFTAVYNALLQACGP